MSRAVGVPSCGNLFNTQSYLAELEGGVKERYEQEEEIVKEKQQGWEKVLEQPKRQKRRRNSDYPGENVLHGSCQSRERRKPRESPELLQSECKTKHQLLDVDASIRQNEDAFVVWPQHKT
ncbi:hypothetical protein RUM43_008899 [Polyplax serrata]|uniref:Uncharacterized protein n=1 Tax=Polyplax serrata TaxID=468196 RepID=A0AAN8PB39_POLSC